MPVEFLDSNNGNGVTDCPHCDGRIVLEFEDDGIYISPGRKLAEFIGQVINRALGYSSQKGGENGETEVRVYDSRDGDTVLLKFSTICECGQRFPDSLFQWRYRLHWLGHKLRKAGSVLGSALMVGMTFGSAGDVSRRSDN